MSFPFRLALRIREKLYTCGVLQVRRLHHPVISIGNLTLGGTGKTPLTIFLAGKMHQRGFRPVILSRGYRRTTTGTRIVSRGDGPLLPWHESGDEPYLMAQRLKGIAAVVVGESRYRAGVAAERDNLGNLFLLDDGFQHRQLHRDMDIVTVDPLEWIEGGKLIPVGRWREPKPAITRAHAACVQEGRTLELPIPQFTVAIEASGIPVEELRGRSITAFAGIAKPERFFSKLESLGLRIDRRVSFPDHHDFTDNDLRHLAGNACITTEKDAVRLAGRMDFYTLRVSANIADFARLEAMILERVRNTQCR